MTANKFEKYWPTKSIYLAICTLVWLLVGLRPAQAQTATPDDAGGASPFVTTVTVTVLDENGDPVAFLPLELHMFEYTASIEAIAMGGCGTDESGTCSIEAVDPPNLSGWMEGMIYIPGLGMEYIGWSEPVKLVVIQLLPGNVLPTPESFLHFPIEGQDEMGTDVPLEMAATLTLAPTATATQTPLPPTGTTDETGGASATQTPETTPTETTLPTATPTATPTTASIFGGAGRGTNYLLLLALVGAVVAAGAYWFIARRSRPKPKKSNPKPEGDA